MDVDIDNQPKRRSSVGSLREFQIEINKKPKLKAIFSDHEVEEKKVKKRSSKKKKKKKKKVESPQSFKKAAPKPWEDWNVDTPTDTTSR